MNRWSIDIPEGTDRSVRDYLERNGGGLADLPQFVDEAARAELFRRTLKEVRNRNADLDKSEVAALANEALDWARADRP